MARWYHKGKTDNNQKDILKELRKIPGLSVQAGHDDLLVGYKGVTYWYEVKNPEKMNKDGSATKGTETQKKQTKLFLEWKGHIKLVWELDQILKDIGIGDKYE